MFSHFWEIRINDDSIPSWSWYWRHSGSVRSVRAWKRDAVCSNKFQSLTGDPNPKRPARAMPKKAERAKIWHANKEAIVPKNERDGKPTLQAVPLPKREPFSAHQKRGCVHKLYKQKRPILLKTNAPTTRNKGNEATSLPEAFNSVNTHHQRLFATKMPKKRVELKAEGEIRVAHCN